MGKVVYPTQTIESEIAISQGFLALRRLSSYTYGVMLYFAYGSNINRSHLNDYLDTRGVTPDTELKAEHALLDNYVGGPITSPGRMEREHATTSPHRARR